MKLADTPCQPCRGDSPALTPDEIARHLRQLPRWTLIAENGVDQLERGFDFERYRDCLDFCQRLGEIAEQADHHPLMIIAWGKVTVRWWTHAIGGLHLNDVVMAARSDRLYAQFG
ncbi:MAG: 4a-hydroxytetrahydrobiopterin dehydratase [Porticoccaceae bacterium]|jgi:4a-hydroxytetrahydrobiopterin dehydratase